MMQSAALVGLWGLTLAAFIIFAAPAAMVPAPAGGKRGVLTFVALAAVLLAAHLAYGALRLADAGEPGAGPAIRIVQPALDQSEKWQAENDDEIVRRYLSLSREASPARSGLDGVAILVWPESAFPFLLTDRPEVLTAIADILPPGTTLITGAVRADEPPDASMQAFNSVLVIDDQGAITAAYDKVHLVPFGEYLPFRPLVRSTRHPSADRDPRGIHLWREAAHPDRPRRSALRTADLLRDHLSRCRVGIRPTPRVDAQPHQRHLVRRHARALSALFTGARSCRGRGVATGAGSKLGDIRNRRRSWPDCSQPWNQEMRELSMGTFLRMRYLLFTPAQETGFSSGFWWRQRAYRR